MNIKNFAAEIIVIPFCEYFKISVIEKIVRLVKIVNLILSNDIIFLITNKNQIFVLAGHKTFSIPFRIYFGQIEKHFENISSPFIRKCA